MGTSRSSAEFTRKLNDAARGIAEAAPRAARESGRRAKTIMEAERRAATSTGRLRNVGRAGARLTVRYDVRDAAPGHSVAELKAGGPWQLIENAARPHIISSRRARGSAARRGRAGLLGPVMPGSTGGGRSAVIRTPWGARRYVRHPGTRGKRPWRKGYERTQRSLDGRQVTRPFVDALRRVF